MDKRRAILDAAGPLFLAEGYRAVSMDRVLEAVGGSKATLYRYFPSKEALLAALVDDTTQRITATGPPEQLYDEPLERALIAYGTAAAKAVLSPEADAFYRLVHAEAPHVPEIGRLFYERGPGTNYAHLRALLEAKRDRGELDFDDSQAAAEHFMSSIVGLRQVQLAVGVIDPPGDAEIDRVVRSVVAMFVRAYAP